MTHLQAIILYSSNDERFIRTCVSNLAVMGFECLVVTYSHKWDGTPEDLEILEQSLSGLRSMKRVHIDWTPGQSAWYWEALGRQVATKQATSEFVMYIDADEIVEPLQFFHVMRRDTLRQADLTSLVNYWYWREPTIRADQLETSVKVLRRELAVDVEGSGGRELYVNAATSKQTLGEHQPFVHHYSWVRSKAQMLAKVKSWGHSADKHWQKLIEQEFSRPFDGTDFLHGYTYKQVPNQFSL